MYVISKENLPFNRKNFLGNIFGQVNETGGFLGGHDYTISSNRNKLNTTRESKNYNSFGKTRKINF